MGYKNYSNFKVGDWPSNKTPRVIVPPSPHICNNGESKEVKELYIKEKHEQARDLMTKELIKNNKATPEFAKWWAQEVFSFYQPDFKASDLKKYNVITPKTTTTPKTMTKRKAKSKNARLAIKENAKFKIVPFHHSENNVN